MLFLNQTVYSSMEQDWTPFKNLEMQFFIAWVYWINNQAGFKNIPDTWKNKHQLCTVNEHIIMSFLTIS